MRRVAALALTSALLIGAAGCSGTDEPERSATCEALQASVDSAQREAEVAISELDTDPTAAVERINAVRDSLRSSADEVAPEERGFLTRADDATERLGRQARRITSGKAVDGSAVGQVRTDLLAVVQDVRAEC